MALDDNKTLLYDMLKILFLDDGSNRPAMVRYRLKRPKETLRSWPLFSVPHLDSWSLSKKGAGKKCDLVSW
jgi:hypothetical protein